MKIISQSKISRKSNGVWTIGFGIDFGDTFVVDFHIESENKSELISRGKEFVKCFSGSEKFSYATVKEFGELYFVKYKGTVRTDTFSTTKRIFNNQIVPAIGDILMKDLNGDKIQAMLNEIALISSEHTIKKVFNLMENMIVLYRSNNHASKNIMRSVVKPVSKVDAVKKVPCAKEFSLDDNSVDLITSIATGRNKDGTLKNFFGYGIMLILHTAISVDEMLALTWDDIDFENGKITITKRLVYKKETKDGKLENGIWAEEYPSKNHSRRTLILTQEALNVLHILKERNGDFEYVVCNEKGGLARRTSVNHAIQRIFNEAEIDCSRASGVELMREYFINKMLDAGLSNSAVVYYLGKADDRAIKKYLDKRKQTEMLDTYKSSHFSD